MNIYYNLQFISFQQQRQVLNYASFQLRHIGNRFVMQYNSRLPLPKYFFFTIPNSPAMFYLLDQVFIVKCASYQSIYIALIIIYHTTALVQQRIQLYQHYVPLSSSYMDIQLTCCMFLSYILRPTFVAKFLYFSLAKYNCERYNIYLYAFKLNV